MDNEDKIVEYLARMCAIIIFGLIIAVLLGMCSCTRTIYVPVTSVERDSIYLHTHTRDSIWIHDSVTIKEQGDTIRIEKWRTKYVEKLMTDTAYIERTDTIVQAYPVEKPLSTVQRAWIKLGKISTTLFVGAIIALIAYIITRKH